MEGDNSTLCDSVYEVTEVADTPRVSIEANSTNPETHQAESNCVNANPLPSPIGDRESFEFTCNVGQENIPGSPEEEFERHFEQFQTQSQQREIGELEKLQAVEQLWDRGTESNVEYQAPGTFSIENLLDIPSRKRPYSNDEGLPNTKRALTDTTGTGENESYFQSNDIASQRVVSDTPHHVEVASSFDIYNSSLLTESEFFETANTNSGVGSEQTSTAPSGGFDFGDFQQLNEPEYNAYQQAASFAAIAGQSNQFYDSAVDLVSSGKCEQGQTNYVSGNYYQSFAGDRGTEGQDCSVNFWETQAESSNVAGKDYAHDFTYPARDYADLVGVSATVLPDIPANFSQGQTHQPVASDEYAYGQYFSPPMPNGRNMLPADNPSACMQGLPTQQHSVKDLYSQANIQQGAVENYQFFSALEHTQPESSNFNNAAQTPVSADGFNSIAHNADRVPVHGNHSDVTSPVDCHDDDDVIVISSTPGRPDYSSNQGGFRCYADAHAAEMSCQGQEFPPLKDYASSIQIELLSHDLWKKFHEIGTEMIITKSGRRMFPTLKVNISGLLPHRRYIMAVDVIAVDNKRYRYAYTSSQWMAAGNITADVPKRTYIHPDSPAPGETWMRQTVVFDKMKLTNNEANVKGHIILHSMHKYQPRIHLIECAGNGVRECETIMLTQCVDTSKDDVITFVFPETQFTTVTAYQNQQITKLKIDKNPFAKGFRDTNRPCKVDQREMQSMRSQTCSIYRSTPPVVTVTHGQGIPSGQFPDRSTAFRLLERPESTLLQARLTTNPALTVPSSQHQELSSLLD